jgi:hypothetical protein
MINDEKALLTFRGCFPLVPSQFRNSVKGLTVIGVSCVLRRIWGRWRGRIRWLNACHGRLQTPMIVYWSLDRSVGRAAAARSEEYTAGERGSGSHYEENKGGVKGQDGGCGRGQGFPMMLRLRHAGLARPAPTGSNVDE